MHKIFYNVGGNNFVCMHFPKVCTSYASISEIVDNKKYCSILHPLTSELRALRGYSEKEQKTVVLIRNSEPTLFFQNIAKRMHFDRGHWSHVAPF